MSEAFYAVIACDAMMFAISGFCFAAWRGWVDVDRPKNKAWLKLAALDFVVAISAAFMIYETIEAAS